MINNSHDKPVVKSVPDSVLNFIDKDRVQARDTSFSRSRRVEELVSPHPTATSCNPAISSEEYEASARFLESQLRISDESASLAAYLDQIPDQTGFQVPVQNRQQRRSDKSSSPPNREYKPFSRLNSRKKKNCDVSEKIKRRRGWDLTAQLPPWARKHFTHGQQVVLAFIGKEFKKTGICEHSNSYISKGSNMCITVVKQAKRIAAEISLISVDPQRWISPVRCAIATIRRKCSQWLQWLDRGPTSGVGTKVTRNPIIEPTLPSFYVRPSYETSHSGIRAPP